MSNYDQTLQDRLSLAAQAKKNMLENFKKSLMLMIRPKLSAGGSAKPSWRPGPNVRRSAKRQGNSAKPNLPSKL
jgi:hypothetical protein